MKSIIYEYTLEWQYFYIINYDKNSRHIIYLYKIAILIYFYNNTVQIINVYYYYLCSKYITTLNCIAI